MEKKGFTLFELLATIVIIAVVIAIAYPKVNGIIGKAIINAYINNEEVLLSSAKNYLSINDTEYPQGIGEKILIPLAYLKDGKFINDIIDIKDKGKNCDGYVLVEKKASFDYNYSSYIKCSDNYVTEGYDEGIFFNTEGLIIHLDASTLNLNNNDKVMEWLDLSDNARNATQSIVDNAPTYSDGKVIFNGINTFLGTQGWPTTSEITAFYVINPYKIDGSRYIIGNSILALFNGKPNIYVTDPWAWHSSTDVLEINKRIILTILNSDSLGATQFFYNGNLINTINQPASPFGYGLNSIHYIGKRNGVADSEYYGEMLEILIFDKALDYKEKLTIELYLKSKWLNN